MSDTSPRGQSALRWGAKGRAARKPTGEHLFAFVACGTRWRCELRTDHAFDVQFFRGDEFLHTQRFDSRVLAEAWANSIRERLMGQAGYEAHEAIHHIRRRAFSALLPLINRLAMRCY
jgi:hypothetical protein